MSAGHWAKREAPGRLRKKSSSRKPHNTRLDKLTADVGSATQKVLFKDLNKTSDSLDVNGGAIYNSSDDGHNIYADFIDNYTKSGNSDASGGAISNRGTIGNITGDFIGNYIGNYASSDYYYSYIYGGAISNGGTINNITGDFIGNYASADKAEGGAIYNSGTIGNITGDFIGNYADDVVVVYIYGREYFKYFVMRKSVSIFL